MKNIPILIIDNNALFCDALSIFFKESNKFEVIGTFFNGVDFLEFIRNACYSQRAVVIVDISLPDISGIKLHNLILKNFPDLRTIFLSSFYNKAMVKEIMDKSAGSFLIKKCRIDELVDAIEQVYYFNYYLSDDVLNAIDLKNQYPLVKKNQSEFCELSKREIEILKLICLQMNNHEIATKLFLSPKTVENHRNSLLFKTCSNNTVGLVLFAIKNDIYFPV